MHPTAYPENPATLCRPATLLHDWLTRIVQAGDTVIDATTGNGHDTLLLAQLAGQNGTVHGFDIQQAALQQTERRLRQAGLFTSAVRLHHAGHEHMAQFVPPGVKAIVFNLGYLPGGDKHVITRTPTTLNALAQATQLLAPGGMLGVMCYPGHPGGDSEAVAVERFFSLLPRPVWHTDKYQPLNTATPAPFLLIAVKTA